MKKLLLLIFLLPAFTLIAQQVPRTVVAEHFTNTYCSICASRNPGLYGNLSQYPQVLHIAYYPSAPYATCPLSQQNVPQNDARTNYYGIYGATPRLVIGGNIIGGVFTDTALFSTRLLLTSSFSMTTAATLKNTDSISVRCVISKRDTSSLSTAKIYGVVTEDTLNFSAANGETQHYDVFRTALWGTDPIDIALPTLVNDSVVMTATVARKAGWATNRLSATTLLQQSDKKMLQASRSAKLPVPAGVANTAGITTTIYPNPASHTLYISTAGGTFDCTVTDIYGREMKLGTITGSGAFTIEHLPTGNYILNLRNNSTQMHYPVCKE